ncbi:hypothetical protein B0H13DRAFT_2567061 [Mycena leptocephala]|nr:hypothetical protein B0H13DRAFT_2567061 [Mycena leptocephala]
MAVIFVPWNPQAASQAPVVQHSTSPLLSSLTSVTAITPTLINQVNAAAASNPTLANLLQLAAAGKGSPEQLKTLGLLIQSLATPESSEALSTAANLMKASAQPPVPVNNSVKEFDLVFQYHETSYERWILPRGPVICEKVADTRTADLAYDIVAPSSAEAVATEKPPSQIVTIRLTSAANDMGDYLEVGGWEEKLNENRVILDNLKVKGFLCKLTIYLSYILETNGEIIFGASNTPELTPNTASKREMQVLHFAAASNHVMKSIKPGPVVAPKPKRKPAQRKPTVFAVQPLLHLRPPGLPLLLLLPLRVPHLWLQRPLRPRPAPFHTNQPDPKRRKVLSKPKPTVPSLRSMRVLQADGCSAHPGRNQLVGFCRPCVDSGKATTVYVPYKPPQHPYQAQQNIPVAPVYAQAYQNMHGAPVYTQAASQPSGSSNPSAAPPPG